MKDPIDDFCAALCAIMDAHDVEVFEANEVLRRHAARLSLSLHEVVDSAIRSRGHIG